MKFLRRTHNRYSKLGKRRKKKQIWRKPTGRDNKMREKRKGYPVRVSIGYKKGEHMKKIIISNPNELNSNDKNAVIVVGNVGKKKKLEIAKKASEMKIKLSNLNSQKFINQNKLKEEKKEPKKDDKGKKPENKEAKK